MTLQLIPSEFPYFLVKFCFLFHQCTAHKNSSIFTSMAKEKLRIPSFYVVVGTGFQVSNALSTPVS
jgi:hypothetical protein